MYETAVVVATEKCSLGAKIPKMSLQAYDSSKAAIVSGLWFPLVAAPGLAAVVGAVGALHLPPSDNIPVGTCGVHKRPQ